MEVPFNGAPKRPGSPSPLTSPAHSTASRGGLLQSCCGRCYRQRYQVRGRRILVSRTSISEGPLSSTSQSQPLNDNQSRFTDPTAIPSVVFNVPGENDRRRFNSSAPCSPYNETRVWTAAISNIILYLFIYLYLLSFLFYQFTMHIKIIIIYLLLNNEVIDWRHSNLISRV